MRFVNIIAALIRRAGFLPVLLLVAGAALAQPANDNFANRKVLSGNEVVEMTTNVGATREANEPFHGGNLGGASIWWEWTATSDGLLNITTLGSQIDTILAVYTGTAVNALTLVEQNDDEDSSMGIFTSQVRFLVNSGQTFVFVVEGYRAAAQPERGPITMTLTFDPNGNNDQLANRSVLMGDSARADSSNEGATKEPGEFNITFNPGGASLWWEWTPSQSGSATFSTVGSRFDTLLAVYTTIQAGPPTKMSDLFQLEGDNDDAGQGFSIINRAVTGGTTYYIQVDGVNSGTGAAIGDLTLCVSLNQPSELSSVVPLGNGQMRMNVDVKMNCRVRVEASTNLKNWTRIGTFDNRSGVVQFTDMQAAMFPLRFYRAVAP